MNHDRAQDLLLDLAYGELAPADAGDVERHLAECGECAADWERIAGTRRAVAPLGEEPAHDDRSDAILDAARAATAPPQRKVRRSTAWTIAATAAVATIVGGVTLKLSGERPIEHVTTVAPLEDARSPAPAAAPGPSAATGRREAPGVSDSARRQDGEHPSPAARVDEPQRPGRSPAAEMDRRRSATAPLAKAPPAAAAGSAEAISRDERFAQAPAQEQPARARAAPEAKAAAPEAPARRDEAGSPESHASGDRAVAAAPRASAALRSQAPRADARMASRALVTGVEQRLAAGHLPATARNLTCDGVSLEQTAWSDGDRIAKLALRAPDGTSAEGWYDAEGRLRAIRARRAGAEPFALQRQLDDGGRIVHEERSGGTSGGDISRWLPLRGPDRSLAQGCTAGDSTRPSAKPALPARNPY